MKLSGGRADGFVREGPADQRVALFHGPDAGAVAEFATTVAGTIISDLTDPFLVATLDSRDVKDSPALLLAEVDAVAFGGGRRVIRVRGATDAIASAVESVLEHAAGDGFVVLEAGELASRSKLRALCEKHALAASIGCYPGNETDLGALVDSVVGAHGLMIEASARSLVVGLLGSDRSLNRSEVEKLCLYKGSDGGPISDGDVLACLADSGGATVDTVVLDSMLGRFEGLVRAFDRLESEGSSIGGVLRQAIRLVDRMVEARGRADSGQSPSSAVDGLRPPIFFGIKPMVVRVVGAWSRESLLRCLGLLGEAEVATRSGDGIDREHAERCFFRIAQMGRRLNVR